MPDPSQYEEIPFSDSLFPLRALWDIPAEKGGEYLPALWHEQLEILFVVSGEIAVRCGYHSFICQTGEAAIINPCEPHRVLSHGGDSRYHCLMIDSRLYDSGALDRCEIKYLLPFTARQIRFNNHIAGNLKVLSILGELMRECREQRYAFEVAVKGCLLQLLAELFRSELDVLGEDSLPSQTAPGFELIAPALEYIAGHYKEKITLQALGKLCNVHISHLCRVFRKVTGKTVLEYLTGFRMAKARALLLTTSMGIGEVALNVGFPDSSYFTRRFKTLLGVSPGELRRIGRRNEKSPPRSSTEIQKKGVSL